MDQKINIVSVLRAFEEIIERGEPADEDCRSLEGISARAEYDGYTLFLTDGRVTLYVYFHNKYKVEYKQREDFDKFVAAIERIASS